MDRLGDEDAMGRRKGEGRSESGQARILELEDSGRHGGHGSRRMIQVLRSRVGFAIFVFFVS